jgi:hypothetical protein
MFRTGQEYIGKMLNRRDFYSKTGIYRIYVRNEHDGEPE